MKALCSIEGIFSFWGSWTLIVFSLMFAHHHRVCKYDIMLSNWEAGKPAYMLASHFLRYLFGSVAYWSSAWELMSYGCTVFVKMCQQGVMSSLCECRQRLNECLQSQKMLSHILTITNKNFLDTSRAANAFWCSIEVPLCSMNRSGISLTATAFGDGKEVQGQSLGV